LIIGSRLPTLRDGDPVDWQDLRTRVVAGRAPGDPDFLFRRHRRQSVDIADRVQDRLAPRYWEAAHLFAEPATIGDDVVDLAVVADDIDIDIARFWLLPFCSEFHQGLGLDAIDDCLRHRFARLFEGHAGNVDRSVDTQANRAVRTNQVLSLDFLDTGQGSQ